MVAFGELTAVILTSKTVRIIVFTIMSLEAIDAVAMV
jgi:hypothetical protein